MSDVNSSTQEGFQELTTTSVTSTNTIANNTNTTAPSSKKRRVAEITTEILRQKDQVVCSFIRIGQLLKEAKDCLKKDGKWLKWLETKVDISVRMAQRYIQLYEAFPDATSISHLGVTKALALLALPEAKRETFLSEQHEINGEKKQVGDMSVREIQTAIRAQTKPSEEPAENTTESGEAKNEADTASEGPDNDSQKANKNMIFMPILSDQDASDAKTNSEEQSDSVGSELLASDIKLVNNQLDGILKILESQASAGMIHGKIADDLRSLNKKVQRCLSLAALEVPSN